MTHCKYILPDGRPVIAIVPGTREPLPVISVEVRPDDELWPLGQARRGSQRRFVLAERAVGL